MSKLRNARHSKPLLIAVTVLLPGLLTFVLFRIEAQATGDKKCTYGIVTECSRPDIVTDGAGNKTLCYGCTPPGDGGCPRASDVQNALDAQGCTSIILANGTSQNCRTCQPL